MAKVTIEDISRQTGLSRGTVSRALNDRPDISEQTKQRVLEACRKLNYIPSHAARSLATGRSFAVAVLVGDLESTFSASFLRGVLSEAQKARYAVHVAELGTEREQHDAAIRAVVTERIDCVLATTVPAAESLPLLREAMESRPAVACHAVESVDADLLMPDDKESGRLVARHAFDLSTDSVLYVHVPGAANALRLEGFQEVCRERGVDPASVTLDLPSGDLHDPEVLEALQPRLAEARVAVGADDWVALTLMHRCWQLGRTVGRDVAIIGQGNERVARYLSPTLSTVDFCGQEIGQRAMQTALGRLSKTRSDAYEHTFVAPLFVSRASSRLDR